MKRAAYGHQRERPVTSFSHSPSPIAEAAAIATSKAR